jgi:hypothetical protein
MLENEPGLTGKEVPVKCGTMTSVDRAPSPWELVILTDRATVVPWESAVARTLFVCYDAESADCLERQGFDVRRLEHLTTGFSTLDELYENYADPSVSNQTAPLQSAEIQDTDCSVVTQHVRFKAVEIYGPILHVWEMTWKVLAEERPCRAKIDVRDRWLRIVLHAFLTEMVSDRNQEI